MNYPKKKKCLKENKNPTFNSNLFCYGRADIYPTNCALQFTEDYLPLLHPIVTMGPLATVREIVLPAPKMSNTAFLGSYLQWALAVGAEDPAPVVQLPDSPHQIS